MRHHVDGDVEVYDGDAKHEHCKGEGGRDTCKDGERDGDDEEEGHDEGIDRVEERHGWWIVDTEGVVGWLKAGLLCRKLLRFTWRGCVASSNSLLGYRCVIQTLVIIN